LDSTGAIDTTFKVASNSNVGKVEIDSLGRVYFASTNNGYGTEDGVINYSTYRMWRSTAAGLLDTGYTPNPNNYIYDLHIAEDDTLYVAGNFSSIGGGSRSYLARLDTTGALDASFPNLSLNNNVTTIETDASGNVILSGNFSFVQGTARARIAMEDTEGDLLTSFDPGTGLNSAASDIEVDALGKIWIGGNFYIYNGDYLYYLTRLNGLEEAPEVESFASFIAGSGLTGADAAFDNDYDMDGIANGLEFLLGGDPTTADGGLLPTPVVQNGAALSTGDSEDYVTISVSIDEALVGMDWSVEASDTLPFTQGSTQPAVQVGGPVVSGGQATYTFRMPWPVSDPSGAGFMRVTVAE